MTTLNRFFREEGLYTMVPWNYCFSNPPLSRESEVREDITLVDRGLDLVDRALVRRGSRNSSPEDAS